MASFPLPYLLILSTFHWLTNRFCFWFVQIWTTSSTSTSWPTTSRTPSWSKSTTRLNWSRCSGSWGWVPTPRTRTCSRRSPSKSFWSRVTSRVAWRAATSQCMCARVRSSVRTQRWSVDSSSAPVDSAPLTWTCFSVRTVAWDSRAVTVRRTSQPLPRWPEESFRMLKPTTTAAAVITIRSYLVIISEPFIWTRTFMICSKQIWRTSERSISFDHTQTKRKQLLISLFLNNFLLRIVDNEIYFSCQVRCY